MILEYHFSRKELNDKLCNTADLRPCSAHQRRPYFGRKSVKIEHDTLLSCGTEQALHNTEKMRNFERVFREISSTYDDVIIPHLV